MQKKNESMSPEAEGTQPCHKRKKCSKKRLLAAGALLVVLTVVAITGFGFASKVKDLHDRGPLMVMLDKITENLDLTEQQKADVQKIRDEIKAKMEEKRSKHKGDFNEFEKMFRGEKLDKSMLKELESKREADRTEMKEFFMDELIKFHSILTPEQRNKVADKMKEFREKKDKFRGEHKHKGPENH